MFWEICGGGGITSVYPNRLKILKMGNLCIKRESFASSWDTGTRSIYGTCLVACYISFKFRPMISLAQCR